MRRAIALSLFLLGASCARKPVPPVPVTPGPPQALDPLNEAERALAERAARADARVTELTGGAGRLAHLVWFGVKPATEGQEGPRHAEALFAVPSGEYGVRAIVRLGTAPAVVEATRIDARHVPMTREDTDEAWQIARADRLVQERLGRRLATIVPEATRTYSEDPNDPCSRGRCFYLLLRAGNNYIDDLPLIVDLATKRVLTGRSRN